MATNNINNSMSGVYGAYLLQQLHVLQTVIPSSTKTLKFDLPFTQKEQSFLHDMSSSNLDGNIFFSVIEHKESMVRIVDTPRKRGIILTIPKVLEIVGLCSFARKHSTNRNDYEWKTRKPEKLCFKLLDIVSFVRESGCNIMEFISSEKDREILKKVTHRSYYSSNQSVPKVFTPLLSSRYSVENFTKIAQTSYFSQLSSEQKRTTFLDVRSCDFSESILRNETTIVRNEKPKSLQVVNV